MRTNKNKKRIDPRYFLNETVDRNQLQERVCNPRLESCPDPSGEWGQGVEYTREDYAMSPEEIQTRLDHAIETYNYWGMENDWSQEFAKAAAAVKKFRNLKDPEWRSRRAETHGAPWADPTALVGSPGPNIKTLPGGKQVQCEVDEAGEETMCRIVTGGISTEEPQ